MSLFILCLPLKSHARDSLIDVVTQANESLVTVKAFRTEIGGASAAVARDPKTGRILVARRAKAAQLSKQGAGVIIHPKGYIVTNLHTVKGAQKVGVALHNGKVLSARILELLPENDLALLMIDPPFDLKPIPIANSDRVRLGDEVINIGNSELLNRTISGGVVYRLGTVPNPDGSKSVELIQANMNLYKGDSGGPLLDKQGRLIGMIAAKYRSHEKATLAIPSNKIKKLVSKHME